MTIVVLFHDYFIIDFINGIVIHFYVKRLKLCIIYFFCTVVNVNNVEKIWKIIKIYGPYDLKIFYLCGVNDSVCYICIPAVNVVSLHVTHFSSLWVTTNFIMDLKVHIEEVYIKIILSKRIRLIRNYQDFI